jgi:large subunit ribosomal protein L3
MKFLIKSFIKSIVGIKLFMDSAYVDGIKIPVTVVQIGPCIVLDIEDHIVYVLLLKKGGKNVAFKKSFSSFIKKKGLFNTRGFSNKIYSLTINDNRLDNFRSSRYLYSNSFKVGDFVDVSSTSKGLGFQGVIKR